jgi:hypothetical protein
LQLVVIMQLTYFTSIGSDHLKFSGNDVLSL